MPPYKVKCLHTAMFLKRFFLEHSCKMRCYPGLVVHNLPLDYHVVALFGGQE